MTEAPSPAHGPPPYVLEDNFGFILRQVTQRHVGLFTAVMPDELTPTQFSALVKLHDGGAVSQTRLGRLTAMDGATIKGVVDRLVRRGLVRTDRDQGDARLIVVSLTPSGRDLARRSLGPAGDVTRISLAPLTAVEQRTLLGLLRRLT